MMGENIHTGERSHRGENSHTGESRCQTEADSNFFARFSVPARKRKTMVRVAVRYINFEKENRNGSSRTARTGISTLPPS
jgi:hypothetical protein